MSYRLLFSLLVFLINCSNDTPISHVALSNPVRYEFIIDSLSFGDSLQPLKGVLFLPKSSNPTPCIIIIQGSGPTDMDGYKVWAESLAVNGFAVLRYNKHYMTYPVSNPLTIAESSQVADIIKAGFYAKSNSSINPSKIFVLGHSEGGNLAPVAAVWQKNLFAGLICAASPAFSVDSLLIFQRMAQSAPSTEIEQAREVFQAIRDGTSQPHWNIYGAGVQYWKEWINYSENADSFLLAANIPAMILQGLADENYPDSVLNLNLSRWQTIVEKSDRFSIHTFPFATHSFLDTSFKSITPDFINTIVSWIKSK